MRFHAPYMEWAKARPRARFDLAISNVLACSITDLPGAADALALTGDNDNGYGPLLNAIASRYAVGPAQVTTAQGAAGANFLVFAALLSPGDDVLVERPGYDPLMGAPSRRHSFRSPVRRRLRARSRPRRGGNHAPHPVDRHHQPA